MLLALKESLTLPVLPILTDTELDAMEASAATHVLEAAAEAPDDGAPIGPPDVLEVAAEAPYDGALIGPPAVERGRGRGRHGPGRGVGKTKAKVKAKAKAK